MRTSETVVDSAACFVPITVAGRCALIKYASSLKRTTGQQGSPAKIALAPLGLSVFSKDRPQPLTCKTARAAGGSAKCRRNQALEVASRDARVDDDTLDP